MNKSNFIWNISYNWNDKETRKLSLLLLFFPLYISWHLLMSCFLHFHLFRFFFCFLKFLFLFLISWIFLCCFLSVFHDPLDLLFLYVEPLFSVVPLLLGYVLPHLFCFCFIIRPIFFYGSFFLFSSSDSTHPLFTSCYLSNNFLSGRCESRKGTQDKPRRLGSTYCDVLIHEYTHRDTRFSEIFETRFRLNYTIIRKVVIITIMNFTWVH